MSRLQELERAAVCGETAARSMRRAIDLGGELHLWRRGDPYHVPVLPGDIALEQAERMARAAHYHACKARPDLRPPDSYARAVAAHRDKQGEGT